jgi:hypothetical protein
MTGSIAMKRFMFAVPLVLIAGATLAQSSPFVMAPHIVPICSPAIPVQTVSISPVQVTLSACGRTAWVKNVGTGNLLVSTASMANYVVLPGAARGFKLAAGDTTMTLQAVVGTSTVTVEQCPVTPRINGPREFCKW